MSGLPILPYPSSTTGKLIYYVSPSEGERAFLHINADPTTGKNPINVQRAEKELHIENLRGKEDSVSLDTAGFQFFHEPCKHRSFANDEEITREYYPETIELIKKLTGASRVELFDHTIRRRRPGQADDHPDRRQPVVLVHVDQTLKSSIARVHRHLPASDAPKLLEHRFQIINLWRPISHPAVDWPLALCDWRSVNPTTDTFPMALIYPDREGEIMGVQHNDNHRWKYLHGMTPDEIVLLKCFDSIQDGSVAIFTPHTGFSDPATPEGTPLRESIEVRALVFYD
ncbi:hypothetical protein GALMADRAFT_144817 [Galerina marginata CBS 339.88]|uniref:Methyltransferase n=1 Tax=Galerina marginata (strain CBS 339.88) TaxID=685588 RepID=A0A067SGR2_GALM3|nr:hypothetical protein GALMADRAFT_144817 [Galerina marginata CBS 339.88]